MLLRIRRTPAEAAVELIAADCGPGVADLFVAAHGGRSTAGTLGIGLGAAMRMATWFDSHSVIGRGTVIVATFWRAEAPAPMPDVAVITRAMDGETVCGDAAAFRTDGGMDDGAARRRARSWRACGARIARSRARVRHRATRTRAGAHPQTHQHDALRGTRGAAAAVVQLDPSAARLTFAGVGNVAVWLDDGTRRASLVSTPGIIGTHARTIREVMLPVAAGSLLIMHSDGLSTKWDLDAYPGLRRRDPLVVAATLMRDAGVHRDDASVVVARTS